MEALRAENVQLRQLVRELSKGSIDPLEHLNSSHLTTHPQAPASEGCLEEYLDGNSGEPHDIEGEAYPSPYTAELSTLEADANYPSPPEYVRQRALPNSQVPTVPAEIASSSYPPYGMEGEDWEKGEETPTFPYHHDYPHPPHHPALECPSQSYTVSAPQVGAGFPPPHPPHMMVGHQYYQQTLNWAEGQVGWSRATGYPH